MNFVFQAVKKPLSFSLFKKISGIARLGQKAEYDQFLQSSILYFNYDLLIGMLMIIVVELSIFVSGLEDTTLIHAFNFGYLICSLMGIYLNSRYFHSLAVLLFSVYGIGAVTMLAGYYGETSNIHFLLFIFGFSPMVHLARSIRLAILLAGLFLAAFSLLLLLDFSFFPGVEPSKTTVKWIRGLNYPFILFGFIYKLLLSIFVYYDSIKELIEKRDQLRSSEAALRSVFDCTTDSVWAVDTQFNCLIFNKVAAEEFWKWYGVKLESSLPMYREVSRIFGEELKPLFRRVFNGESITSEFELNQNGFPETFIVSFSPIVDNKGQIKGCTIYSKNISEFKQAERALQQNARELNLKNEQLQHYIESNLQLENFAYMASHDLKEPLRAIICFSQLLHKKYRGYLDEEGQEYVDYITTSTRNMENMISDLLAYAKIGTQESRFERVAFQSLLKEAQINLFTPILESRAVITTENLPATIYCVPSRIKQLLQNLISNGIKFQEKGSAPQICINGEEHPEHWKIIVQDNGLGIKPDFQDKIFLLFRKLHSKHQFEGTGIGLAICKKIVEQHGGQIGVDSVLGKGSSFYFTLQKNHRVQ